MQSTVIVQRVVVFQYSGFWTLSPREYGQLLAKALLGKEWVIPGRASTRRPKWIYAPVERGRSESHFPKDRTTLFAYMPCDWEMEAFREKAWELYDALGDLAPSTFPLCPWCGFDCAMARNNPVPLVVYSTTAACPDCDKDFILMRDGWEESV